MVNTNLVSIKINNIPLQVPEGTRILDACRDNGFHVPYLCYLKDINEIGACRVCVVEVKGIHHLVTSCNNQVQEGMEILTNSPRVREARKINVELLLSQHHTNCPTCVRSSNCELKQVASDLNLTVDRYKNEYPEMIWTSTFPLIRDAGKCIKCMRCVQICDKIQTLNIWDVSGTGSHTTVDVSHNLEIKESDCSLCGQCVTHCPTAALQERDDVEAINGIHGELANDDKVTVAVVAPAVRAAWGEEFGLSPEFATDRRFVSTLKSVGFDYVFDVDFAADLTIMEESNELLARLQQPDKYSWPMFTSCCPAWVKFCETRYPELADNISTCRSPQQMFGAVIREYYRNPEINQGKKLVSVSIMPCTAKKEEILRPESMTNGRQDVDYVLTTTEVASMIRKSGIRFENIDGESTDMPFGIGSGGGVIFGVTGGVTEAVLRRLQTGHSRVEMDRIRTSGVRGDDGLKELTFDYMGKEIRAAVVNGLGNADKLIKRIQSGEVSYDFVEVMACPGGCVAGAGTLRPVKESTASVERFKNAASSMSTTESPYLDRLKDVEEKC